MIYILRAFEKGADGVYLVGCLEGDCRFTHGNLRAKKRVIAAQKILDTTGIGGERVQMFNLSSGEAVQFARIAQEMTDKIIALGPNPVKEPFQEKRKVKK